MRTLKIIFSILFLGIDVNAQNDTILPEFPSAREIKPIVTAKIYSKPSFFVYEYSLRNENFALQRIWEFFVETYSAVEGAKGPDEWEAGYYNKNNQKGIDWTNYDSLNDVFPNTKKEFFTFRSEGLPSIVKSYSSGFIDYLSEEEFNNLGSEFVLYKIGSFEYKKCGKGIYYKEGGEFEFKKGSNDRFYNSVVKYSIGPADPPLLFVHLTFLDTLASYKHQAVTLGWIVDRKEDKDEEGEEKGDGIVAKLDKRLSKARSAIIKGDSVKARDELKKFVKKVEDLFEESEEHEKKERKEKVTFTSEAYALLKYNAEYLIDRLPKQKGGKDHDDKDHH